MIQGAQTFTIGWIIKPHPQFRANQAGPEPSPRDIKRPGHWGEVSAFQWDWFWWHNIQQFSRKTHNITLRGRFVITQIENPAGSWLIKSGKNDFGDVALVYPV